MSKINVKMTQPKYIIKPEDGVVICSIAAHGNNDCYKHICDVLVDNPKLRKKYGLHWIDSGKIFTAVAKLHKGDKWEEIKGKRIAESKCKRKIYEFYLRLYTDIMRELVKTDIKLLNHHSDNLVYCLNREAQHLKELMK